MALSEPSQQAELPRLRWKMVFAVILLAVTVRVVCVVRAPLIGTDSWRFLSAAENIENGDHLAASTDSYHPMTAFLIAGANRVQSWFVAAGDPSSAADRLPDEQRRRERAAFFVIALAGIGVVILSMDLTRRFFPGIPAEVVGALAAAQPYFVRSSADIMSDSIFLGLFLLALRQAHEGIRSGRHWPLITAGGCAGLAYLTRPEGLLLVPAMIALFMLARQRTLPRVALRSGLMGSAALLLVVPYAYVLRLIGGEWTLTLKKSVDSIIGLQLPAHAQTTTAVVAAAPAAADASIWDAMVRILVLWISTTPEVLWTAAVLGVLVMARRREWGRGATLYALICGAMAMLLVRLSDAVGDSTYVCRRHVFMMTAMSLPFAARGIHWCEEVLVKRLGGRMFPTRLGGGRGVILLIAMVVMIPKAVAPQRQGQLAQRDAAQWILEQHGVDESIFTKREKVPYYAGGEYHDLRSSPAKILIEMKQHDRAWLVFYEETVDQDCAGLLHYIEKRDTGLELVREFSETDSGKPRTLQLYRWQAQ